MSLNLHAMAGRPPHEPTEQSRRLVRNLAGLGLNERDTARMISISRETLRKYYEEDMEAGRAEANVKVAQAMFKAATRDNPNVVAGMFWLKNRAGWKDVLGNPAGSLGPLHLHLTAAREIGKQILELRQTEGPMTVEHEGDGQGYSGSLLDAPPPSE
jgi:hypothetical protein